MIVLIQISNTSSFFVCFIDTLLTLLKYYSVCQYHSVRVYHSVKHVCYPCREIDHDFEAKAIIMKNGDVTYCPQNEIKSTNCEEKSGSVWECNFKFLSWSYDKVMLDIHFPSVLTRPSIDMSIYYEHDEYEIVSQCAVRREMSYPCRVGTYPELTYTFVIRRRRSFCRNLNASPTCN